MRIFAAIQLFYLFALASSVFSSVHVDHAGSHGQVCTGEISAYCHSESPHEHDEAHPGEDSLWEHIFEDGASLLTSFVLSIPGFSAPAFLPPSPEILVFHAVSTDTPRLLSLICFESKSPRAPPVPHV